MDKTRQLQPDGDRPVATSNMTNVFQSDEGPSCARTNHLSALSEIRARDYYCRQCCLLIVRDEEVLQEGGSDQQTKFVVNCMIQGSP